MYFIEELNSSWSRFQAGSTWMGWVVSSEVQRRQSVQTLNTASVRPIYIITMLEFSRYQSRVCWNLTHALETQFTLRGLSMASLSLHLQTSRAAQMLLRLCREASLTKFISKSPIIRREQAPWGPWLGTSLYTSPKSSSQTFALQ